MVSLISYDESKQALFVSFMITRHIYKYLMNFDVSQKTYIW